MRVTWRTATEEDVAFLTDVAVLTLQDQGRWPEGEDEAEYRAGYADWTRQQLRGVEPDSELYVLERTVSASAGCASSGRSRRRGGRAAGPPGPPGQGIGTDVVRRLGADAHAAGLPLELGVEKDNPRARALYQRLGLRPVGEDDDEIRMRLDP